LGKTAQRYWEKRPNAGWVQVFLLPIPKGNEPGLPAQANLDGKFRRQNQTANETMAAQRLKTRKKSPDALTLISRIHTNCRNENLVTRHSSLATFKMSCSRRAAFAKVEGSRRRRGYGGQGALRVESFFVFSVFSAVKSV
jgi:hypothetical protein